MFLGRENREENRGEERGSERFERSDSSPQRAPSKIHQPRRVKSLASIAAAAVVVALVASIYGTWATLSAQATVSAARADTELTLTTTVDVKAGDILKQSTFATKEVPRNFRARNAYTPGSLNESTSPLGRRALVDLPAGSQITPSVVAGSVDSGYLAASLESGMQAVTIAVDAETGLAGQLRPSDRVRVVALDDAASGEAWLNTICDNVRVASLDNTLEESGGGYSSVTLVVTPQQADAVRSAQFASKVSLVLLPTQDIKGALGATLPQQSSTDQAASLTEDQQPIPLETIDSDEGSNRG